MLIIVDYGLGNLGSIRNMLKKVGCPALISSDPKVVATASKLVLPGVGAFDHGMSNLRERELLPVLHDLVRSGRTPVLGICLGMQLLADRSEEGNLPGLGWIPGNVVRFRQDPGRRERLKIPHIGWNFVHPRRDHALFSNLENPRFYFVHSYHMECLDQRDVIGVTEYSHEFASMVARDHVWGTQFHPEKSHRFGMALFRNFAKLGEATDVSHARNTLSAA